MSIFDIGRRRKPLAVGLLRTAPFIAAGVLSLVLYYSQGPETFDWKKDTVIAFIFTLLSWTVYFAVSHQLPYSKKNIIEDLLLATLYQLGGTKYRINIMELRTSETNAFMSFFKITYGHGYSDASKYKEKITLKVPGASVAFENRAVVYTGPDELDRDLDPDVKHLWSAPIKNRRGESVAVLNIDNIGDDTISEELKEHLQRSIERLADLIAFYWEIPA